MSGHDATEGPGASQKGKNQAISHNRWKLKEYLLRLFKAKPPEALEKPAADIKGAPAAPPEVAQKPTPPTEKTQTEAANTLTLTLAPGVEMEFVRVPAGEFRMGSDNVKEVQASDNERPQHTVYLDEYYIGRYPVTNRQYQAFVQVSGSAAPRYWQGGAIPAGKEKHPVVNVSWEDATAFCAWASERTGKTVHLPSEAQWEKAARGTDGRIYPWGEEEPDKNLCNLVGNRDIVGQVIETTKVGKYSPRGDSPYGCADMAGNGAEWVNDWYSEDYYWISPHVNPPGPSSGYNRVLRSGFFFNDWHARCAYRDFLVPVNRMSGGFRAAVFPLFKALPIEAQEEAKGSPVTLPESLPEVAQKPTPPTEKTQTEAANTLTLTLAPGVEMEFVRVLAGEFLMGSDKTKDPLASDDELPQHTVHLDEYYIGKYPVTNRQYQAFVQVSGSAAPRYWQGGAIPAGKEKHPVVNVSWEDATAFCAWASERTGKTVHLPSEAQWEKAARGTDGRIFPWGDEKPNKNLCNYDSNEGGTTEVGKYSLQGDSPYGCADVAGNVWEWVNDWYGKDYYTASPPANPPGPASGNCRVLRGGSFVIGDWLARCALRLRYAPNVRSWNIGVRVVVLPFF